MTCVLLPKSSPKEPSLLCAGALPQASTTHSWKAAPWHFAYDTYFVICTHQHNTRPRFVRHLQRRGTPCPIALIHHDTHLSPCNKSSTTPPPTPHTTPTAHKSLPRLTAAIRLQGPLPLHNIQHLSSTHPFVHGDCASSHQHRVAAACASGGGAHRDPRRPLCPRRKPAQPPLPSHHDARHPNAMDAAAAVRLV